LVTPDGRYYRTGATNYTLVNDEWVISYEETERNVDTLKATLLQSIKDYVGALLSPSDWRVIREMDGGTAMTDDWKSYRNEVRTHGNSLESGVESFASVEAVRNFQNHAVVEVRYESTYDADGNETIGSETEDYNRTVDKTHWGWPTAPDAVVDPYHKEYK
jgi:hypothetical protein